MLSYTANLNERIKVMKCYQFFLASLLMLSTSAHAFSVNHQFLTTIGAFDAAKVNFTYQINPQDYAIRSLVSTNGFFNTLYPFVAQYDTSGTITADKLVSRDYRYISRSRFKTRSKQVYFDDFGHPLHQVVVTNSKEKKRTFPPAPAPADTFDLQTIMMKIAYQYNRYGFCGGEMTVYDGKRLFNVTVTDYGNDDLPQNSTSPYFGSSQRCSLQISKTLNDDDDTLWEFATNKSIDFWIMRDKTTNKPFIARVRIKDTPLGELNAYATQIKVED